MLIKDSLYGSYDIEKVLEELILSKPVQRLKGIHQGGASYLVNKKWNETRYDHSVGVMLLIRKLGGSLDEQITGLLHDVSHTAFSHVIDFVLGQQEDSYHEEIFQQVVMASEIPQILERHGYCYRDLLLDNSKWTLLEQAAPELCADRVDYTLRDMYKYGQITQEEAQRFLENLIIVDGKMFLRTIESAEWFVETYYKEVIDFFLDPLNVYGYDLLTKAIKVGFNKNVISLQDMLSVDEDVMNLLRASSDPVLHGYVKQLNDQVKVCEDKENFHTHLTKKTRLIDPCVFINNELVRASSLSEKVKAMNETALKKSMEGTYVRVVT
ncbi:HD domain-containing protein [Alkalihalobacterium elongatum]|uniref:HD domain-containing protein n=1 Tax=Alkalihalobacterium elongatum TaxID=2675466 RepID=UPI001C1F8749|nr:HD domain-containing protein [Alkalihalobacterium elongatum]